MSDQTTKPQKPKKVPIPLKLIVGAVSGVFGSSLMFPIYLVKTSLQAFPGKYKGPIDCFQQIIRTEGGIKALYRGLQPNLIGVAPEKALKLAVNEHLRERFENDNGSINLPYEILAGGSAGFCQVIITNPMEITVIRMHVQGTLPETQRSTMINVVRNLGIKGLYTGSLTTLARDVPFSILFFPVYANLKSSLAYKEGEKKGQNSISSQLLAGGAAGAFAAGSVTPADVVKTRLQLAGGIEKYKNMPGAVQLIFKEEGFSAFYKGAVPRMVVFGPLFAITLLAFEAQKEYMTRHGLL